MKLSIKKIKKNEIIQKTLSILTISIGGWIIFDKVRNWLTSFGWYDKYWYLLAIGLLWLGLVFFDIE